jgi:hypothetical protein
VEKTRRKKKKEEEEEEEKATKKRKPSQVEPPKKPTKKPAAEPKPARKRPPPAVGKKKPAAKGKQVVDEYDSDSDLDALFEGVKPGARKRICLALKKKSESSLKNKYLKEALDLCQKYC